MNVSRYKEGSVSIFGLHIDIYVRMCQEQWNHGGSSVIPAAIR